MELPADACGPGTGCRQRPPCRRLTPGSAVRSLALGLGTLDLRMPNVQGKVLGPGRSLTTLLDNRATGEAREDIRRQLRRSLECLVGVHFTEGNAITVLRNGDEIFPAMLEAIGKAQYTVDLMTFVYWKGRPAQQFADALCDRARAGLRVRVLIDALGGIQIEDGIVEAMEDSGVDVHRYRKLWLNSPFKQNHRGHRKVCIIDETI